MSSMGIQLLPQQLVPLMPILDAMSDGVLVVDASGSIIAVNKSMRRFYQGGETPFPGYPLADFNAADWVEAKRVLTSGKPLLGQTMHLPAATVVANRLPILQNGKVAGVVCEGRHRRERAGCRGAPAGGISGAGQPAEGIA